jgi:hypothetical protein
MVQMSERAGKVIFLFLAKAGNFKTVLPRLKRRGNMKTAEVF